MAFEKRHPHHPEKHSPFVHPPVHQKTPTPWEGRKPEPPQAAPIPETPTKSEESPGLLSSLWSGAKNLGQKAYHGLTSWNFEGRDARNGPALPEETIKQDPAWRQMGAAETIYHDNHHGTPERKYVKENPNSFLGLGGQEAVFDGDTGQTMERGPYQATYNYVNPAKGGIKDLSLEGIGRNLGHFALDVVPYWFGGTVRGDEGTTFGQRVLGPEKYEKASDAWQGAKGFVSDKASAAGKKLSAGWDTVSGWFGGKDEEQQRTEQQAE